MTEFSYQLYSSREFPPLDATLSMLKELGYVAVEGYRGVFEDPAATRAALDAAGLPMRSAHFGLDSLEDDRDGTLATAKTLGLQSIYCPFIMPDQRPDTAEGWTAFGERLQALAEPYRAAGYDFGWHNHDFEFRPLADGSVPIMLMLDAAPDVSWEADIAWIVRGGADPFAWIAAYHNRISAVHIKDIAPEGENADEDGWTDVGHGTMPWSELMTTLKDSPVRHFIMEHDEPNDHERFARRSIEAARRF